LKRLGTLLLVCLFAITLVLAGCTKSGDESDKAAGSQKDAKEDTSGDKKDAATTDDAAVSPAGEYPIVKDKITLKVMASERTSVEDMATNEFTKELEEKTNIHIEWTIVPQKNVAEKLNLMLVSGEYPDVLIGMGVNKTQEVIYGGQGVFLPLNDMIEKYGVETKKLMETLPLFKETISSPDGNVYSLPKVNQCFHCTMPQKLWIYQPWLDKLGLSMPTTTDEFYNVLKAFKEKDPNGNGKPDEIPFASSNATNGWFTGVDDFLMNSFIYNNKTNSGSMIMNGDKIDIVYDKPEWKEGLKYLRKLYQDGLLAPESLTQDKNQLMAIGNNPGDVLLGVSPGGFEGEFISLGEDNNKRWLGYKAVPPLKGPNGVQLAAYNPISYYTGEFVITKSAKNPEAAFRLADMLYTWDNTMRLSRGKEGDTWEKAKDGDIGINGQPAKWAPIVDPNRSKTQNTYWEELGPINLSDDFRLSQKAVGPEDLEVILYTETKQKYEPYKPDVSIIVPPLVFTEEQAGELAGLQKSFDDYRTEMVARFVTGDADLEKDWDSYVQTLKDMKLSRLLEIYQQAYDATKK